eukprot:4514461-Alexandrium_andersonii.AAC.1
MSASLVGSEMCIRDRPLSTHLGPPQEQGARPPTWVRPKNRGPVRPFAVSYTHLTLPTICSV